MTLEEHIIDVYFFIVAECLFGKQPMELGAKWFADLGPPFGVMYCIKCECVPVSIVCNIFLILATVSNTNDFLN